MTEPLDFLIRSGDSDREAGRLDSALQWYRKAAADYPELASGPFKEGTVLSRQGLRPDAENAYRKALELDPRHADAANNLAMLLVDRGEWDEAERLYRQTLADAVNHVNAHVNFAKLLLIANRWWEALYYARRAAELAPGMALAWVRSGAALRRLGRVDEALVAMRQAVDKEPELEVAWLTLAGCLQDIGDMAGAEQAFERAVALADDDPAPQVCRLFFSNYLVLSREDCWVRHREFGRWARLRVGPPAEPSSLCVAGQRHRLRIGFVSGDFRRHSVAYFVRGALDHIDRQRFQLYAYHDFHKEDEVSAELKPLFNHWRDIFGQPDDVVRQRVLDDHIDILFDLSGHTAANRLMVFARRAAPLQVSYLGYPNTTGLDTMDYRLTDSIADPLGDGDSFHSELLWRLPRSFLCYAPPESAPAITLREGAAPLVLGSFNMRVKISEACVDVWARILNRLPDAVLLLKSVAGNEEERVRDELKSRFAVRGVAADRISVLKEMTTLEEHLALYGEIDIALDTFPYAGTTTTCEALWMGVPVVSLRGDRHASRVGASLLTSSGFDELVADNVDQYERIVVDLAADGRRRHAMRAGMRERLRSSQLFDRRHMADALGMAFDTMWRRFIERYPEMAIGQVTEDAPALRLQFGGEQVAEGWRLANRHGGQQGDFVADLKSLDAFSDDSCDAIWVCDGLEEVEVTEMLPVVNGLCRLLRTGGSLYVSIPDLDVLAGNFVDPMLDVAEKFQVMRVIYGQCGDGLSRSRIGLNFDFMIGYFREAGFSSVEQIESVDLPGSFDGAVIGGHQTHLHLLARK